VTGDNVCAWQSSTDSCVGCPELGNRECGAAPNCAWNRENRQCEFDRMDTATTPSTDSRGNSCGNDATVDVSGPLLALRNGRATGVDQSCKAVSNSTVIVRNSCPFNPDIRGSPCTQDSCDWAGLESEISADCCEDVVQYCARDGNDDEACANMMGFTDPDGLSSADARVCQRIRRTWREVTIPTECDCVHDHVTISPVGPGRTRSPTTAPPSQVPCEASVRIVSNTEGSLFRKTLGEGFWLRRCPRHKDCFELKRCHGSQGPALIDNIFDGCMERKDCGQLGDDATSGGRRCMSLVSCDWNSNVTNSPTASNFEITKPPTVMPPTPPSTCPRFRSFDMAQLPIS
jgi:hypothetical protein